MANKLNLLGKNNIALFTYSLILILTVIKVILFRHEYFYILNFSVFLLVLIYILITNKWKNFYFIIPFVIAHLIKIGTSGIIFIIFDLLNGLEKQIMDIFMPFILSVFSYVIAYNLFKIKTWSIYCVEFLIGLVLIANFAENIRILYQTGSSTQHLITNLFSIFISLLLFCYFIVVLIRLRKVTIPSNY